MVLTRPAVAGCMRKPQVQLDGEGVKWQLECDTSTVPPGWLLLCRNDVQGGAMGRSAGTLTPQAEKLTYQNNLRASLLLLH